MSTTTSEPIARTVKRGARALLLLGLIMGLLFATASPASASPSVDSTSVCVEEDGTFRFSVDFTDPDQSDEIVFRVNADNGPFATPLERFQVNIDGATGQPLPGTPPEVATFGSPTFDRWADGAVGTFSATSLGGGQWRAAASLAPGTDPFGVGDTVWGVVVRTSTSPDATATSLTVAACSPTTTTTTTTTSSTTTTTSSTTTTTSSTTTTSTTAAPTTTSTAAPTSTLPETGLGDGIRGVGIGGIVVLIAGVGLLTLTMVRTRKQE